jgi:HD-GYP domain-containing protein (c-di-GMP phosphodiesterase class II)
MTARELGLDDHRIERVRRAALLHDLGKIGIPDSILLKSGRLTRQEYELIKRHAPLGAELIEKLQPLSELAPFIRHHHERFDGRGYPEGLTGEQIPLEARILSLADTIEAMASDRPYRPAQPAARIMAEVRAQSGAQFDPVIIAAFERVLEREGMSIITNSAFSLSRLAPQFTQGIDEDRDVVYAPHPTGHLDGIPRSYVHD